MKTSHRIAAALVTALALTSCTGGADTDDDIDQPGITTDEEDDDGSDTSVEESDPDEGDGESED